MVNKMTKERTRRIIGENIRRERIARKISMEELALMLNLTPGFIGLIERGQRGTTSTTLHGLSQIFNLSIDTLFESHIGKSEAELAEINQEEAGRQKVAGLIFDFNKEELDFIAGIILGLRSLRGLQTIDEEEVEE